MKKTLRQICVLFMALIMTLSFSVSVSAASAPKSTSIEKLTAASDSVKIQYKKVSGITGYQIRYATNSSFNNYTKVTTAATQKTIKGLSPVKKYYFKVRTYKKTNSKIVFSSWSKVKSVTTLPADGYYVSQATPTQFSPNSCYVTSVSSTSNSITLTGNIKRGSNTLKGKAYKKITFKTNSKTKYYTEDMWGKNYKSKSQALETMKRLNGLVMRITVKDGIATEFRFTS